MLTKYNDCDCVVSKIDLTEKVKAGTLGTVCYGPRKPGEPYLVDFDLGDEGIIEVSEDDLLPYKSE